MLHRSGPVLRHRSDVVVDERGWADSYAWKWIRVNDIDAQVVLSELDGIRVDGVMTYSETCLEVAAEIGRALGLPHVDPELLRPFRDKQLMRERLAALGIEQVSAIASRDLKQVSTFAEKVGYPVVLKPRAGHSSIGVVMASDDSELYRAFQEAGDFERDSDIVIEEFLDGPEVSVECIADGRSVRAVAVTEKRLGRPPYFEEAGHTIPSSLPLSMQLELASKAVQVLCVLGFSLGVAHVEIKHTSAGPRTVEVNGRLAGDFIPMLVELATGVDLISCAGEIACGGEVEGLLSNRKQESASIEFVIPEREGEITSVRVGTIKSLGLVGAEVWAEAGQAVALPPNHFLTRLGYVMTKGPNHNDSLAALREAMMAICIDIA